MRLHGLPNSSSLSILILILFLLTHLAHTAPTPLQPILPIEVRDPPGRVTHRVDIHRRAGLAQHTLANGWVIRYRVLNVIMPIVSTQVELRALYNRILTQGTDKQAAGVLTGRRVRFEFGKVVLEFLAEQGFDSQIVGWDIVLAFAEKMLEGGLPMTYICHVAPPWSQAGIQIALSVLV
ncbi:MAG: hypothetical protein Q9182_006231 [Xanthomendoza sp. 2 TL-2023]